MHRFVSEPVSYKQRRRRIAHNCGASHYGASPVSQAGTRSGNPKATLRAVGIDDQDDSVGRGAIAPSPENVRRGVYRPLSRTLFIYVNVRSLDRPVVADFVNYYLKQDEELVRQVGGIAMSSRSYELVRQRVAGRMVGTLFASAPASISDLELVLAEGK